MARTLAGPQQGRPYGRRAQAETVMSMIKRNQGDALRARLRRTRRGEQLAVAHDLMLLRRHGRGSRQSQPAAVAGFNSSGPSI